MSILDENFVLNNGIKIPKLGTGTWQVSNDMEYLDNLKDVEMQISYLIEKKEE